MAMMTLWDQRVSNPPSENLNQLLYDATAMAEPENVVTLLARSAMIVPMGEKKDTALHLAAKRGLSQKLAELVKVVPDVNLYDGLDCTPLVFAASKGHH